MVDLTWLGYLQYLPACFVHQVMEEAAQASASIGGRLWGAHAVTAVNHIAHLSGALIGVVLIWMLSRIPSPKDEK